MRKRILILALALFAVARTANDCARCVVSLGNSNSEFQQYFRALRSPSAGLNPLERFVFSLVLANTKTSEGTQPRSEDRGRS
jgi:hypothetical protein